ncbi:head decoration protein [Cupriavidus necator]
MALNEGKHTGEFLLSEGNGSISREEVTIAAAAGALVPGTVMGKITASSKYVAYNNAAADGSEVAAAVLYADAPDLAVDQQAVVIARQAEVIGAELTGLDTPAKADLAAIGIIVR